MARETHVFRALTLAFVLGLGALCVTVSGETTTGYGVDWRAGLETNPLRVSDDGPNGAFQVADSTRQDEYTDLRASLGNRDDTYAGSYDSHDPFFARERDWILTGMQFGR